MKKIENVVLWQCEHCKKKYQHRGHGQWHETHCKLNPNNKHKCFENCKFLEAIKQVASADDHGNNGVYVKGFHCTKKDVSLYSYVAERKRLLRHKDFVGELRMPTECEDYNGPPAVDAQLKEFFEKFNLNW